MAVYVDNATISFRRMIMCHMFADSLSELHDMAARIGMRRQWFQPFSFPHYDVAKGRRAMAVKFGAVEVDRRQGWLIRKRLRTSPAFLAEWKLAVASFDKQV